MLTWHYVTSAAYKAAGPEVKTSDKLFFLSDTHEIYRGTQLFSQAVEVVADYPETPAVGRLYIHQTTLEGKIYTGSAWQVVIQPVQAELKDDDTAKPVSGKAVAGYVAAQLAGVTANADKALNGASYDAVENTITFTRTDGTDPVAVEITDLPCDLKFTAGEGKTGKLKLLDKAGQEIGTGVDLDLERFVKSGEYNADTKVITLYFDDLKQEKVEIDATALVDIYTGKDTQTSAVTVSKQNEISVDVKVSAEGENQIQKKADGLFVAKTDISGKQDLAVPAAANNIAVLNGSGQVTDSKKAIGGSTLAEAPNADTLATEAAVDAIRDALTTSIDGKIAKMGNGAADVVVMSTADGSTKRSTMGLGGATLNASPNATTLATEAGVKAYADGAVKKEEERATGAESALSGRVDTLEATTAALGTAANKNVEFFATAAQGDKADAAETAIAVLNGGTDQAGSVDKKIMDALTWKTSI